MERAFVGLIYALAIFPRTGIMWEDVQWNRQVQKTLRWWILVSVKDSEFLDQLNPSHIFFFVLFLARQPPVGHDLLIHEVSRSHTTTHHSR